MSRSPISTFPTDSPVTLSSPSSFNPVGLTISSPSLAQRPLDRALDREIHDWETRAPLLGKGKKPLLSKIAERPLSILLKTSFPSTSPRVSSHPEAVIGFLLKKQIDLIQSRYVFRYPVFEDSISTPPIFSPFC